MEQKQSLEERVQYLENRVAYLEKKMELLGPKPIESIDILKKTNIQTTAQKEKKSIEWDALIFHKVLPRLFIFVLIIGILWGFKAASDYGFLTEKVKVLLGFVVSAAMILLGFMQLKRSRNVLGQVLIGGAIPVLMITTFAMHQLYNLTGPTIAFILNVLWIGLGLFFTHVHKSQGVGIVSSIGGVLVPFLIESTSPNIPFFILYETILYILFIWLALKHSYFVLYYVSAVLLNLSLFIFVNVVNYSDYKLFAIFPVLAQQVALLYGFLKTSTSLNRQAYTLFGSVILSSAWITFIFDDREAAILFGSIAILFAVCYYVYKNDELRAPIFIANAMIGTLLMCKQFSDELIVEVLIGSGIVYMFIAKKYKSLFHAVLGIITYVLVLSIIYESRIEQLISWELLHWIALIAATGFALYYIGRARKADQKVILNFGIPYFSFLLLAFTAMLAPLLTGITYTNVVPIIRSLLWICIAVGFMVLSKRTSIIQGKYVGAGVLFITLARIIVEDIYFVSVAVKASLFILLGIVGLLVSRAYYKKG